MWTYRYKIVIFRKEQPLSKQNYNYKSGAKNQIYSCRFISAAI